MSNNRLGALSEVERQEYEACLVEFDEKWRDGAFSERASRLPSRSSWRLPALHEMVRMDLERQWAIGNRLSLETYLREYPELGNASDVSADLIQAEYEVRKRFDTSIDLDDYARRFPAQIDELRRLIASGRSSLSPRRGSAPERTSSARQPPPVGSLQELPKQFGRYQILGRLGKGGMGSVYLAQDTRLKRKIALKVSHISGNENREVLERFYREAEAAAALDHPYLCKVFDVGEIDNIHYLAMEYIEGTTLASFIANRKERSQRQVAAIVGKLALALQEAHSKGVVHRDLKPANVMIRETGQKVPVIVDFGLAKLINTSGNDPTLTGEAIGTPQYMPIEQAKGNLALIGPPCDIYALGIILYELLTGEVPFDGPDYVVIARLLTTEPAPPSSLRPDLDPKLEAICLRAMAKQIKDRYASMAEFAAALGDYLKAPTTAVPDTYALAPQEQTGDRISLMQGSDTLMGRFFEQPEMRDSTTSPGDPRSKVRRSVAPSAEPEGLQQRWRPVVAGIAAAVANSAAALNKHLQTPTAPVAGPNPVAPSEPRGEPTSRTPRSDGSTGQSSERPSVKNTATPTGDRPSKVRPVAPPTPEPKEEPKKPRPRRPLLVGLATALVVVVFGVVVYVVTDKGRIKITVNGPKIVVEIDGTNVSLKGLDEPITLRAGEHEMTVVWGTAETETRKFIVRRGSNEQLVIEYDSGVIQDADMLEMTEKPVVADEKKKVAADEKKKVAADEKAPAPVSVPLPKIIPFNLEKTVAFSTGMELVLIPAGHFMMGASSEEDPGAPAMEMPRHRVHIRPFFLGVTEVTQGQYQAVTGQSPSFFKGSDQLPVEQVSWYDAIHFCNELSGKERLPPFYKVQGGTVEVPDWKAPGYRLPTEAEREYACRVGTDTRFSFGKDATHLGQFAWFNENSDMQSHPVKLKLPNPFGLYDMQGNVWEWCWDGFDPDYYRDSPTTDPRGPSSFRERVDRGGSWRDVSFDDRSTSRFGLAPDFKANNLGFRVARYPSR